MNTAHGPLWHFSEEPSMGSPASHPLGEPFSDPASFENLAPQENTEQSAYQQSLEIQKTRYMKYEDEADYESLVKGFLDYYDVMEERIPGMPYEEQYRNQLKRMRAEVPEMTSFEVDLES